MIEDARRLAQTSYGMNLSAGGCELASESDGDLGGNALGSESTGWLGFPNLVLGSRTLPPLVSYVWNLWTPFSFRGRRVFAERSDLSAGARASNGGAQPVEGFCDGCVARGARSLGAILRWATYL